MISATTQGRWPRRTRLLLWAAVLAVAAMIFLFSCQSGDNSWSMSGGIVERLLVMIKPDYPDLPAAEQESLYLTAQYAVRKTAHFLEYALLGFFLRLLTASYALRRAWVISWGAGALYAATDELHQLLSGTRTGMWQDVLLDSAGVLAGAAVAALVLWVWLSRKAQSKNQL